MANSLGNFQYKYKIGVTPNEVENGIRCKHDIANIQEDILPNHQDLPTSIFSFKSDDNNATFWHNTVLGKAGKNMLSVIASAKWSYGRNNFIIIITEKVTISLRQWSVGKTLSTRVGNNVVIPSDDLVKFMRGILAGAGQAQKLNGNAVINQDYIYLVEGVAKISLVTQTFKDHPLKQFVQTMKKLFGNATNIPTEFSCFFYLLELYYNIDGFFYNLSKNPLLYKMKIRAYYRNAAAKKVEQLSDNDRTYLIDEFQKIQKDIKSFKVAMKWSQMVDWQTTVKSYATGNPFKSALTPPAELNVKPYENDAISFLKYGRNLHQHPGNLSHEEIEVELIKISPDFFPCFHEAMPRTKNLVGVTEEMDNIPR